MSESRPKSVVIWSIAALIVLVIAQALSWLWEGRLNPGIFMGMGVAIIVLLGLRGKSAAESSSID